jgi:hypothetical protein
LGGLPKKAFKLDKLQQEISNNVLVDAGALLFAKNTLSSGLETEQAKITAAAIVEGYSIIGYEAVGIARQDLAGGISFLKEQANRSTFPWISANLVDRTTQKPIFHPSLIIEKNGLKIGITGLTGLIGKSPIDDDPETNILPWQQVLPQLLPTLEKSCDIIILLSNLPHSENQILSKQFDTIHVIIQSGITINNLIPILVNNTLICQSEKQGKHLGQMEIKWHSTKKWRHEGNPALSQKQNELDRINWQLKRIRSKGVPEILYKNRPKSLLSYHNLENKVAMLKKEIFREQNKENNLEDQSSYQNKFIPIKKEYPDQENIAQIIEQAKIDVNAAGKQRRAKKALAGYKGTQTCKSCHIEQYDNWQATPHAKAYETLVAKSQQFNVDCLPCHVTGIDIDKGHLALSLPQDLLKVGCENCHGPGQDHAATPEQSNLLTPSSTVCLKCHTDDHDDDFDYKRDRQLVH